MKSYQQFFAELKRRRVFRVMAVYGVIGFGLIEAAGEIFPRVGIPDWAITLVVWLALLGFPIAVVLAWAFESSPEGMKRTEDATPEEISEIIAQPAASRWSAGLLALTPDSMWARTSLQETARGLAEGRIGPAGDWGLGSRELLWMGLPDSALALHQQTSWVGGTTGLVWNPGIWEPEFDSLRSDPRIRTFMERAGQSDAVLQRTPVSERTRPMILERAP